MRTKTFLACVILCSFSGAGCVSVGETDKRELAAFRRLDDYLSSIRAGKLDDAFQKHLSWDPNDNGEEFRKLWRELTELHGPVVATGYDLGGWEDCDGQRGCFHATVLVVFHDGFYHVQHIYVHDKGITY